MEAPDPVYNVVCFLAPQCAEKCLKAVPRVRRRLCRKTHDLVVYSTSWPGGSRPRGVEQDIAYLTPFAIAGRYPGMEAGPDTAAAALRIAGEVRRASHQI